LGILAALVGIAIMRGVAFCEALLAKTGIWQPLRPALGGLAVGLLALATPQVMSSGHGALHFAGFVSIPLMVVTSMFLLKALASIISLGSGFRGGLFFATLFLGALGGHLFAGVIDLVWPSLKLDPNVYAIIGMSALSASVIGGPPAMSFIALESTGNLWLTTAVLVAVMIATQITRELFGYSFATWRFHLRGETIRSAADIGWMRDLTVSKRMRHDVRTVPANITVDAFRESFPLGSPAYIIAIDEQGRYVGMVAVADAHATEIAPEQPIKSLLRYADGVLEPGMTIKEAVLAFDRAEAEALAVVNSYSDRRVIGLLTESFALRRYAAELERRRNEMIGD